MPLFDFEAFSIFAENYIISNENVAVACDINGEVCSVIQCKWKMTLICLFEVGLEDGSLSYSTNMENYSHVL